MVRSIAVRAADVTTRPADDAAVEAAKPRTARAAACFDVAHAMALRGVALVGADLCVDADRCFDHEVGFAALPLCVEHVQLVVLALSESEIIELDPAFEGRVHAP